MSIDKLLRPKRVAVIGASEQEGFGGDTCRNIIDIMDKDRYYFVNPNRDHVLGIKCYHSVEEIPNNIDLAVICTPMRTVEDIIKSCAKNLNVNSKFQNNFKIIKFSNCIMLFSLFDLLFI